MILVVYMTQKVASFEWKSHHIVNFVQISYGKMNFWHEKNQKIFFWFYLGILRNQPEKMQQTNPKKVVCPQRKVTPTFFTWFLDRRLPVGHFLIKIHSKIDRKSSKSLDFHENRWTSNTSNFLRRQNWNKCLQNFNIYSSRSVDCAGQKVHTVGGRIYKNIQQLRNFRVFRSPRRVTP